MVRGLAIQDLTMSAAIVSSFHHDYRDLYKGFQTNRATTDFRQQMSALEKQLNSYNKYNNASSFLNISNQALNNLSSLSSVKSPIKQHAPLTNSNSVANCNAASQMKSSTREHRKLDRSVSEPADRSQVSLRPAPSNSSRYKTELCRPYEENGTCKYGDKCQFAHGMGELRTLSRHPKYKTELCRTFHTTGFCPYGPRCHFIHNSDDSKKCLLTTLQSNGSGNISPPKHSVTPFTAKDLEICGFSLGSAGELSPTSSNSSGSPTSPDGDFLFDDNHQSYMQAQVPQTAPPTVSNGGYFFGPDYTPALTTLSNLVTTSDCYSSQQVYEAKEKMINLLVADFDNMNCQDDNCVKSELSPKSDQNNTTALDINRNILRLPIFSRLALAEDLETKC